MAFSGDLVLHTHMRMNGSWHIYRPGERWQRPARDMRVLVGTDDASSPSASTCRSPSSSRRATSSATGARRAGSGSARRVIRSRRGAASDARASARRHRRRAAQPARARRHRQRPEVGDSLRERRRIRSRQWPTCAATMPRSRPRHGARRCWPRTCSRARRRSARASGRRTTRSLDPDAKLWVYGRGGRPCRRCGARIEARQTGVDARLTYWCPRCQSSVISRQSSVVSRQLGLRTASRADWTETETRPLRNSDLQLRAEEHRPIVVVRGPLQKRRDALLDRRRRTRRVR